MKLLALALLITTGSIVVPISPESLSGAERELPSLQAYAVLMRPFVVGCTPFLKKWSDGSKSWGGCPTNACPQQGCVYDGSDSDTTASCYCEDGGAILCKGIVYLDEGGLPTSWSCQVIDCQAPPPGCHQAAEPPAPPTGYTSFYICDCR